MRDGFLHADVSLQLIAQRRHSFTFDTARYDVAEPRHVSVTVQSQTVRRDVSTTVDSLKRQENSVQTRDVSNDRTTVSAEASF